jgi:hypothetical protein
MAVNDADLLVLLFAALTAKGASIAAVAIVLVGTFLATVPVWRTADRATRSHLVIAPIAGLVVALAFLPYSTSSMAGLMSAAYDSMIDGGATGFVFGLTAHALLLAAMGLTPILGVVALYDSSRMSRHNPGRGDLAVAGYLLCIVAWTMGASFIAY